jgi:hypothetical protein
MWTRTGHVCISVTQEHIEKALRRNSSHCAIALAVAQAVPDARFISVDLQSLRFSRKGLRYCFLTPHQAQAAIIAVDQGDRDAIRPFDFSMRPAFITRCGKSGRQTPSNGELKGSGLTVNKKQMHLPDDQQQPVEEKKKGERDLSPDRSDGLAAPTRMPGVPDPKRRRARAKVSTAKKGYVPTVLGGKLPPIGVLSRREYGLRQLRR